MRIRILITIIAGLYLILTTLSCGSDSTAPNIGISSPAEGTSFEVGDEVTWIGVAADDISLELISFTSNLWTALDTCDILLEEATLFYNFEKPLIIDSLTPNGDYTFTATCMDGDQNAAVNEVNFSVITDLDPTIVITSPTSDTIITRDDTLRVIGTAKDDIKLTSAIFSVDSLFFNTSFADFDSDTCHVFNIDIPVVDTAAFMLYLLEIVLSDSRGQTDTVRRTFTLQ